jgi:hypothetical protein
MPATLSKEAEEQIINAAKTAVDMVDDESMSPTDAIEKLSRDNNFGPDKIRFLSYAYNTGRQTAQRESADNALDKFAEFPIADPEKVISNIWPDKVKTAADLSYETVSDEYSQKPAWLATRAAQEHQARFRELETGLVKVAAAKPDPGKALGKAIEAGRELNKAASQARGEATSAYANLLQRLGQLGDYFKYARDRHEFAHVDLVAKTYFGDHGTALMDWVFTRNKMARVKTARADSVQWGKSPLVLHWTAEPWNHLSACIDLARTVNEKRAEEIAAKDRMLKHAADHIVSYKAQPVAADPLANWSILDVPLVKQAEGVGDWIGSAAIGQTTKNLLDKSLGGSMNAMQDKSQQLEDDTLNKLNDPAHDAQLRQIRTQAMLSDLMNDEVIGGYDPDTVLQKYNELSQLTPRAASQPLVMRSQLRRHLQGDVQPFEHNEALNIEKGIRDSHAQPPPVPASKPKEEKQSADEFNLTFHDGPGLNINF